MVRSGYKNILEFRGIEFASANSVLAGQRAGVQNRALRVRNGRLRAVLIRLTAQLYNAPNNTSRGDAMRATSRISSRLITGASKKLHASDQTWRVLLWIVARRTSVVPETGVTAEVLTEFVEIFAARAVVAPPKAFCKIEIGAPLGPVGSN